MVNYFNLIRKKFIVVADKPKHVKIPWILQEMLLQDWNKYASSCNRLLPYSPRMKMLLFTYS